MHRTILGCRSLVCPPYPVCLLCLFLHGTNEQRISELRTYNVALVRYQGFQNNCQDKLTLSVLPSIVLCC